MVLGLDGPSSPRKDTAGLEQRLSCAISRRGSAAWKVTPLAGCKGKGLVAGCAGLDPQGQISLPLTSPANLTSLAHC